CQFRLWLISGCRNAINDLLDLFFAKGRRILARAHKPSDSRCAFNQVPRLVARPALVRGFHLYEDVAGIEHFLRNNSFAASHFHNFFSRNEHIVDLIFEVEGLHPTPEALGDFAFESRVRMDDEPVLGHQLCSSRTDSEMAKHPTHSEPQELIDGA